MRRNVKRKRVLRKRRTGTPRVPKPFGVTPTDQTTLTSRIQINMLNATVPIPYSYYYLVLTNPLIWNNGAASTTPFFTKNAAGYRKFTVVGGSVNIHYANSEATTVSPYLNVVVNSLLPNTLATAQANFQNPETRVAEISPPTGNSTCTLSHSWTKYGKTGFRDLGVEDSYVGLVDGTSSPSDNIYAIFGHYTGGIASIIGVNALITIKFNIRFIEKQTPIN